MKRFLFFSVFLIFSLSGFIATAAAPHVGDSVTYEGLISIMADGKIKQNAGFIQEMTVLGVDNKALTVNVGLRLYLPDGSEKESQENPAFSEFKSRAEMQEMLKDCTKLQATFERIQVTGGNFDTCKFSDSKGGFVWLGDVPFNIVKTESIDPSGNLINLQVSNFSFSEDQK